MSPVGDENVSLASCLTGRCRHAAHHAILSRRLILVAYTGVAFVFSSPKMSTASRSRFL